MKKTLLISMLIAMMSITVTSCDPDDDYYYYDAPFLGSWMSDDHSSSFTFYANGTGVYTDFYTNSSTSITWEADDYNLWIYPNDGWGDTWSYQWDVYGNTLELFDLDYGGYIYYYAY